MKESVKSPPSNTQQPKDAFGCGKQFFSPGKQDAFFNATGIKPKLNVGGRGDQYEQQADAMADQVVSRSAQIDSDLLPRNAEKDTIAKTNENREGTFQRKPVFESDGEQDVQRSVNSGTGKKICLSENDTTSGSMNKGDAIVAIARSNLGKVKAKQGLGSGGGKQLCFGYEKLLEIFQLAAPGIWDDDTIQYVSPNRPSWCGIFTVYCIKKAGIDIGNWQKSKGVSSFGKLKETKNPQAGDIGYITLRQHHAIIVKVEGDYVYSIDGNSGLQSEIIEITRPRNAYAGFFTALHNETNPGEVQKKEDGASSSDASPSVEERLHTTKGQGSSLDDKTRQEMEHSMGGDFSNVRVHTGHEASQLSDDLNAQAFAHGNDIYFNEGKYNPESSSGKHLLAHELTHTIQQKDGVQKMIQKKEAGIADYKSNPPSIELPDLKVPGAKKPRKNEPDKWNLPPIKLVKENFDKKSGAFNRNKALGGKKQAEVWDEVVPGEIKKETEKIAKSKWLKGVEPKTGIYYLKHQLNNELKLIGKLETITENAVNPSWNRVGRPTVFQIDHARELQVGGKNDKDNLELLESSVNAKSGGVVKGSINEAIDDFITEENKQGSADERLKNKGELKSTFDISFKKILFPKDPRGPADNSHYWTYKEITEGRHLEHFIPMNEGEKVKAKGSDENKLIYTSIAGGQEINENEILSLNKGSTVTFAKPIWGKDIKAMKTGSSVGSFDMTFSLYRDKSTKTFKIPILKMDGVDYGGGIPRSKKKGSGGLQEILVGLNLPGLSPITMNEAEIVKGKGLVAKGIISSTLPVIKGVELDFAIEGNDIIISKTFSSEELKIPKPFNITNLSLMIFGGTKGFGVKGDVDFEIKNVGIGKITGTGNTDGDFGIKGKFDFDPKLFKRSAASIEVEYNNKDGWSAKGELQIAKGSVKGIKSGKVSVGYASEVLKAEGTAETTIKGIKEVSLNIIFGKEVFEMEGGVKIDKLPGIKDGDGTLKVVKIDNEYDFSGKGKITPDIPGVDTLLDFEFHNDIFLVDAQVVFEKGRLKGKLNVGITNRAVDAEGKPTGDALPDIKVFGNSSLQLKITDKLLVNAGVKLLENGEIEVKGGIKLPEKFEVVPKLFSIENKPIVKVPPIHIPLFGIPLGVATIGIEAVITPRLDANVQIGPGNLTNVGAEVTYNPSHPDDMSITGAADFEFIAEAGITAGVDFGLSASIAVASLTGGINLSAFIKAAAQQPVFHADVKYSPRTGFELNGNINAKVQAILGFSGNLFVKAAVGIWPLELSKTWEWPLFKKEVDTGLQIGFEFPFGYKDGKADFSLENIKFTYPSLEDITSKVKEQIVDPQVDKF